MSFGKYSEIDCEFQYAHSRLIVVINKHIPDEP